jgi:hypothetical protein
MFLLGSVVVLHLSSECIFHCTLLEAWTGRGFRTGWKFISPKFRGTRFCFWKHQRGTSMCLMWVLKEQETKFRFHLHCHHLLNTCQKRIHRCKLKYFFEGAAWTLVRMLSPFSRFRGILMYDEAFWYAWITSLLLVMCCKKVKDLNCH